MIFPELRSARLLLRKITIHDKVHIFEGLSDKEVIQDYGVRFETLDSIQEQMDWFQELEDSGDGLWWAITEAESGAFLGACGLNYIDFEHLKAEFGIWILPEHWGKGIMTEALQLIQQYVFNRLQLHRLEGFVEARNEKALAAMKRLGFQLEGTMRDCEIKGGKFISMHIVSMLDHEYELK